MNFYIADTHFGHKKILTHCKRDFASVEEMDETIINNWNAVVSEDDDVYLLGDFGHTSVDLVAILKRLKGRKHLVIGNHDRKPIRSALFRHCFVEIHNVIEVHDNGVMIVLSHYPMAEWNGYYQGAWHFYGHIHNNGNLAQQLMEQIPRAVNVGVDKIGFMPRTAKELMDGDFNEKDTPYRCNTAHDYDDNHHDVHAGIVLE